MRRCAVGYRCSCLLSGTGPAGKTRRSELLALGTRVGMPAGSSECMGVFPRHYVGLPFSFCTPLVGHKRDSVPPHFPSFFGALSSQTRRIVRPLEFCSSSAGIQLAAACAYRLVLFGGRWKSSGEEDIMEFKGAPRLMIVSDLDSTMVDHEDVDNKSLLRFGALWEAGYNHDSLLVYSTGRSPSMYFDLRQEVPLLTPGIAILSVGTEIMYGDTMTPDHGWVKELSQGWDRATVVEVANEMNLKFQCDSEQRPHKVSFHVRKEESKHIMPMLLEKLEAKGLDIKLVYSKGLDLDVLPKSAGKGQALAYLMRKLKAEGRATQRTLVCGDSGNDAELYSVDDVCGVIVSNAQDELLQWHAEHVGDKSHIFCATERCTAGIIQAMQYFGMEPNVSPRDRAVPLSVHDKLAPKVDAVAVAHEVVEYLLLWEQWLRGDIDGSDEVFRRLKFGLAKNSSRVCAWGIIENPYEEIENLWPLYGSQKGKNFHIWVDRVRTVKLSEDSWLVRFDKWQRAGTSLTCSLQTALLQTNVDFPNGLYWRLIHETWLKGYEGCAPITT